MWFCETASPSPPCASIRRITASRTTGISCILAHVPWAALDYAKKHIRVNAVGPGPVETPLLVKGTGGDPHSYASFVPMGRIGQPDEIADAVVWLMSDEARYVTGHTLPVDGGVCSQ